MLKFLSKLPSFFVHLFQAAKKVWEQTNPMVKLAILQGSGIIAIINQEVSRPSSFILQAIQAKHPELTADMLKDSLQKVATGFNIAGAINNPNLEIVIDNIRAFLASHKPAGSKSKIWAILSHSVASIISIALAPPETKAANVINLMDYGYQTFIKKEAA